MYGRLYNVSSEAHQLVRWSVGADVEFLDVPSDVRTANVSDVSGDGSTVALTLYSNSLASTPGYWTEPTGVGRLPGLTHWSDGSATTAVSADGSTFVGFVSKGTDRQAIRWTNDTEAIGLGFLGDATTSSATLVSPDGQLVVGVTRNARYSSPRQMFAWTDSLGMVNLSDILSQELGMDLPDSLNPVALSADGQTLIGSAIEFDVSGQFLTEWPWAITLDLPLQELLDLRLGLPDGDFDKDGQLTISDLQLLVTAIRAEDHLAHLDVSGDQRVDQADFDFWVHELKKTWFGDADLNGEFASKDLVTVFLAGKYEQGSDATWSEGDWNADESFTSGDLIVAFLDGGYEQGPRAVVSTVPEPSSVFLFSIATLTAIVSRTRRKRF